PIESNVPILLTKRRTPQIGSIEPIASIGSIGSIGSIVSIDLIEPIGSNDKNQPAQGGWSFIRGIKISKLNVEKQRMEERGYHY
ncbi:MAG TPA: hypothetical protein PKE06_12960, partial [Flavilitoribacter sp.]|nr:hypothetical protein [Flavilitoribacter sp.]HMQ86756.1 hypothetical protein [Flavilitoribacter sp.]